MTRYEILIPLNYNDKTEISQELLEVVPNALRIAFGGFTNNGRVSGEWKSPDGKWWRCNLIRYTTDSGDFFAPETLKRLKIVWKQVFKQEDIYIVSYPINVI